MKINPEKLLTTAMVGMWCVTIACVIYAVTSLNWRPIQIPPQLTTAPSSIVLGDP